MHYLSIAMKIFSVFAVFALTSASALASKKDLVHLVKRACTDTICIRASQTMLDECGVNAATDYDCLCNNMDDDFYEDFYGCTLTCPRASLQGTGITSASDVKDAFCSLVRGYNGSSASTRASSSSSSTSRASSSSSTSSSSSSSTSRDSAGSTNYASFAGMLVILLI